MGPGRHSGGEDVARESTPPDEVSGRGSPVAPTHDDALLPNTSSRWPAPTSDCDEETIGTIAGGASRGGAQGTGPAPDADPRFGFPLWAPSLSPRPRRFEARILPDPDRLERRHVAARGDDRPRARPEVRKHMDNVVVRIALDARPRVTPVFKTGGRGGCVAARPRLERQEARCKVARFSGHRWAGGQQQLGGSAISVLEGETISNATSYQEGEAGGARMLMSKTPVAGDAVPDSTMTSA